MFLDIELLLEFFSEALSDGDKNASLFAKRSTLLMLSSNIVLKKLSNPSFRPFGNYSRLKKENPRAVFTSCSLENLGYIKDKYRF